MAPGATLDWQIGVFGQNEASRIADCLRSIAKAAEQRRVLATLVLNGTTDDSAAVALQAAAACALPIEIYRIAHADKSNAINRFFYDLRVPARYYCCVDAYVTIGPESLSGLADCLDAHATATAATGISLTGRTMRLATAETLEHGGVFHGQLNAPRREFVDRLTQNGFRLPVGLYRGDGLLGSMAAHDLDALGQPWESRRILGVPQATYEIVPLSPFRLADLRRHFRRKIRQQRGELENAAIKEIIYRHGYAGLPEYADDMIGDYLREHGVPAVSLIDWPFLRLALRQHRRVRRPDPARLLPVLIASTQRHASPSGISPAAAGTAKSERTAGCKTQVKGPPVGFTHC